MKSKLISELGEGYEYSKIIVENKIELAKIDIIEKSSTLISYLVLYAFVSLFLLLLFVSSLIVLSVYLSQLLGSIYLAYLVTVLVGAVLTFILFLFRKKLIYKPIQDILISKTLNI